MRHFLLKLPQWMDKLQDPRKHLEACAYSMREIVMLALLMLCTQKTHCPQAHQAHQAPRNTRKARKWRQLRSRACSRRRLDAGGMARGPRHVLQDTNCLCPQALRGNGAGAAPCTSRHKLSPGPPLPGPTNSPRFPHFTRPSHTAAPAQNKFCRVGLKFPTHTLTARKLTVWSRFVSLIL